MKRVNVPARPEAWFSLSPFVRMRLDALYDGSDVERGHGKRPAPRRALILGGKAVYFSPPSYNVVAHEMGHVIDIDDRRVLEPGFGLRMGKWVDCAASRNGGFWEVVTGDAIRREIHVSAIQATIVEHWGFTFDYAHAGKLLDYVEGYLYWRNSLGLSYDDMKAPPCDDDALSYGLSFQVDGSAIRSLRETMSIEAIWAEWVRKTRLVERRLKRRQHLEAECTT